MKLWLVSFVIGLTSACLLVGTTFVLLVGQAIGKASPAIQSLARVVLGLGQKLGDDRASVTLAVSVVLWTVVLTLVIGLSWSRLRSWGSGRPSPPQSTASMPRSLTFLFSVLRLMPRKSAARVLTPPQRARARSIRACSIWSITS